MSNNINGLSCSKKENRNWVLDNRKFLTPKEKQHLIRVIKTSKESAEKYNHKVPIKDWIVVNIALRTGLRVSEIAALNIGDVFLSSKSYLVVRRGKNGKSRVVWFGNKLKSYIMEYIEWKKKAGENLDKDAPLLLSSNTGTNMTTRALQKSFSRCLKKAGIANHSIHHARHTYATELYRASKNNLLLVQKQLGHSSINVTEVYAHVYDSDRDRAIACLDNMGM